MNKPRKKSFVKIPRYSGGKELLRKFINDNLNYPKAALENRIEGDVTLSYRVNSKGEVFDIEIEKGIGFGCDEEAIRLLNIVKHDTVKNRGLRVTSLSRIRIPFRLKSNSQENQSIVFEYKKNENQSIKKSNIEKKVAEIRTYSYITIK